MQSSISDDHRVKFRIWIGWHLNESRSSISLCFMTYKLIGVSFWVAWIALDLLDFSAMLFDHKFSHHDIRPEKSSGHGCHSSDTPVGASVGWIPLSLCVHDDVLEGRLNSSFKQSKRKHPFLTSQRGLLQEDADQEADETMERFISEKRQCKSPKVRGLRRRLLVYIPVEAVAF